MINKSITYTFILFAIAIAFSSCSATRTATYSQTTTTVTATANTQNITPTTILQVPKMANLDVDIKQKISGRAEGRGATAVLENLREQAVYEALKMNSADVLVEPAYKVTTTSSTDGTVTILVEVMGFAGRYQDIHDLKKSDIDVLKLFGTNTTSEKKTATTAPAPEETKVAATTPAPTIDMRTVPTKKEIPITAARIKHLRKSGTVQTVLGPTFIALGIGTIIGGLFGSNNNDGLSGVGVSSLILGSFTLTTGFALTISGPVTLGKAHRLQRKLNSGKTTASFFPVISPNLSNTGSTAMGVGMRIKF